MIGRAAIARPTTARGTAMVTTDLVTDAPDIDRVGLPPAKKPHRLRRGSSSATGTGVRSLAKAKHEVSYSGVTVAQRPRKSPPVRASLSYCPI